MFGGGEELQENKSLFSAGFGILHEVPDFCNSVRLLMTSSSPNWCWVNRWTIKGWKINGWTVNG